jgi:hypothetical protein
MIREAITVSVTGYARTEDSKPTVVLRFAPGKSSVAAGIIQIAGRTEDCVLFTVSKAPGSTARFDPVFPPDSESDVRVHVFVERDDIVVQVSGPDTHVDWAARADLVLIRASQ